MTVPGARWGKWRAGSLPPCHSSQRSGARGVYPFLVLPRCAHWWAGEHIQNVFGAVSYYVLKKNNKLHTGSFSFPLSFKATGELKIPSSFQGPHRVRFTTNRRVPPALSPCLLWRAHSAPAESPLGPSASGRTPSRAPPRRHRRQAAHSWQHRAAPPPATRLLLGPPGLRLLFQMIKHTVLRSSKPSITRLPHGQESCHCLFRGTAGQPPALSSLLRPSPFLGFPLPLPSLFSSLLFFPSPALFPILLFPLLLFVLPCPFLSRAPQAAL